MSANENQSNQDMLDEIRKKVLQRDKQLREKEEQKSDLEATIEALEEITDVPREEIEQIVREVSNLEEKRESKERMESIPSTTLPALRRENLPTSILDSVNELPEVLQQEFLQEYQYRNRWISLGYLSMLIPPFIGVHYLYLRRFFLQILFWITGGGFGIWWLIDIFRMPEMVMKENGKIAEKILKKIQKQAKKEAKIREKGTSPNLLDQFMMKVDNELLDLKELPVKGKKQMLSVLERAQKEIENQSLRLEENYQHYKRSFLKKLLEKVEKKLNKLRDSLE